MAKKQDQKKNRQRSSYEDYYDRENQREEQQRSAQFRSYDEDPFWQGERPQAQRSKQPGKKRKHRKRKYRLAHPEKLVFIRGLFASILILSIVLLKSMRKNGESTAEESAKPVQVVQSDGAKEETGTIRSVNRTDLTGIPKQLASYMASMVYTNTENYKKEPTSLYEQTVLENSQDLSEYRFVIAIDAGHGGTDAGWQVGDAVEKEITLKVAEKLAEYINQHTEDYYAILLRSSDMVMTDQQRVTRAIENHAGLIVSLHCNGSEEELGGTSAVYWTGEGDDNQRAVYSEELANQLMAAAAEGFGMWEREVRTEDNPLLRTTIPSVMVEMGYLTYEIDHEWVTDETLQAEAANKMGSTILEFVKEIAPKSDDSDSSTESSQTQQGDDSQN